MIVKTGKHLGSKELLSKEMVVPALDKLHTTIGIDGKRTCHPIGMFRLTSLFNEKYSFKGNTVIIRNYIKNCPTCRVNNRIPATVPPPPKPIRTCRPHSRLQIDLIDMAPRKRQFTCMSNNRWNFRYIVSVKCCFSKFCWLFRIQNKNADDIYALLYVLFQKEGCPDILQSDNGSEFIADIIIKLCHDFGVRVVHGRPHHPQSQGQIENQNKVIKRHLAHYLQTLTAMTQAACWPILLPFVADVLNNTPSTTTNDKPFCLYKNREPKSFGHFIVPEDQFVVSSMYKTAVEYYIFSENDLKDAAEKFESVDENDLLDSVGQLSAASISHSCAGVIAPLFSHRIFADNFAGVGKKSENSIAAQSFQSEDSVESEYSTQSFKVAQSSFLIFLILIL